MYSASLITAIIHTLSPDTECPRVPRVGDMLALVRALGSILDGKPEAGKASVPIVGRTTYELLRRLENIRDDLTIDEAQAGPIVWGRIPVEQLVRYFPQALQNPAETEYFDLGTPLRNQSTVGSAIEADCGRLAAISAKGAAKVGVAIIDRGDHVPGSSPEDFGGKVNHVITQDMECGQHSLEVLWVMLDRLNRNGTLPDAEIACALVPEPKQQVGLQCFSHANVCELLSAMQKLRNHVGSSVLPWAINLSVGAHVGPHNGESPFEEEVSRLAPSGGNRFLIVAAGNEGLSGIAAKRSLEANKKDYLNVRVGAGKPKELFIEFWWEEPNGGSGMVIEAMPIDPAAGQILTGPVRIDAKFAGSVMAPNHPGFGADIVNTLFHTRAHNNMSCAALGISSSVGLPSIDLEIGLEAATDIIVNAWIVVCEDARTAFVEGGNEGTIMVPATAKDAVCIAGLQAGGQPWARSSRGPAADYSGTTAGGGPPHMAYLVAPGKYGSDGTSFSAPRATADVARVLADPKRRARCTDAASLADEILTNGAGPWNSRTGYGEVPT